MLYDMPPTHFLGDHSLKQEAELPAVDAAVCVMHTGCAEGALLQPPIPNGESVGIWRHTRPSLGSLGVPLGRPRGSRQARLIFLNGEASSGEIYKLFSGNSHPFQENMVPDLPSPPLNVLPSSV
jgi:hypothetical protein